ncbi:MAG: hypothetical protein DRJ40_00200 [Thermoprotei archaeon]|nr:MAG: hypothetical protein DRJ40_00200 [Thermoprotei archaeon]
MRVLLLFPTEDFDVASVLRFLYACVGVEGFDVFVLGCVDVRRVLRYSRVPVSVLVKRLHVIDESGVREVLGSSRVCGVVDPRSGTRVWSVNRVPDTLVIDYVGSWSRFRGFCGGEVVLISSLGSSLLTYEGICVLYEFFVRRGSWSCAPAMDVVPSDLLKQVCYVASKVVEAIEFVDNFYVVAPSTLVSVLRNVYARFGYVLELRETGIKFDHVRGFAVCRYVVDVYRSRDLSYVTTLVMEQRGNELKVYLPRGVGEFAEVVLTIDFERRLVHVCRGLVIGREVSLEELSTSFTSFLEGSPL